MSAMPLAKQPNAAPSAGTGKHKPTPGAWRVRRLLPHISGFGWVIDANGTRGPVARVPGALDHVPLRGDESYEADAILIAAAPDLLLAAKNNGGGDLFIEDYGRTCHCPYFTKKGGVTREGMMNPKNHATSCNNMWEAICKAEGRPL